MDSREWRSRLGESSSEDPHFSVRPPKVRRFQVAIGRFRSSALAGTASSRAERSRARSAWTSSGGSSVMLGVGAKSPPSNIPMLPEGQPHAEHHLGGAEDLHPIWLLGEPLRDPTGTLGTDHPQPGMLLWSQELYKPISERDYRESLNKSPLPHGALSFRVRCTTNLPILQLRPWDPANLAWTVFP